MTIRVVIAEDEAIIRLDLRETLEEEGYDVVGETGRGDEAVALVRDLKPDLAILDIKMPGMDGLEAARLVTAERICGVLMLTAFSQREVIEEARDAGALAYLVKPYQKSDLIPAIEVAIGRFREMQHLTGEVDALGEQLESRKIIDRALILEGDATEIQARPAALRLGGGDHLGGRRRRPRFERGEDAGVRGTDGAVGAKGLVDGAAGRFVARGCLGRRHPDDGLSPQPPPAGGRSP